jgi:hypothetical protein
MQTGGEAGILPGMKRELIELIEPCSEEISEEVATTIMARGKEAVPALVELLEDEELARADSHGGWISIHAAWLLAKMNATEAIEPMLRVLVRSDSEDLLLFSELVHSLTGLGPAVLEPALAEWERAGTGEGRAGIEEVLAGLGVRDDRILRALLARLETEREGGAELLGQYGDPAALPRLSAALDASVVDLEAGPFGNQEIVALEVAITDLGGTLSESQARKTEAVDALRDEWSLAEETPSVRGSRDPAARKKKAQRKAKKKARRRNRK